MPAVAKDVLVDGKSLLRRKIEKVALACFGRGVKGAVGVEASHDPAIVLDVPYGERGSAKRS